MLNFKFEVRRNCFNISKSEKIKLLIDGINYFTVLAETCKKARKAIYICGWDLNGDIRILRGRKEIKLREFFEKILSKNKNLHIYFIIWDFYLLYDKNREFFARFRFNKHKRMHFIRDDKHPMGASRHDKYVVIDDTILFLGGFDISHSRWDDRRHKPDNPLRYDKEVGKYPPFHDIQAMVQGKPAKIMGKVFRERYYKLTTEHIDDPHSKESNPWPNDLQPDFKHIKNTVLARTNPAYGNDEKIKEIENLYIDSINSAENYIYIENQYFTSKTIYEALKRRIKAKKNLEIVMIISKRRESFIESQVYSKFLNELLDKFDDLNEPDRIRVFTPAVYKKTLHNIKVHSKIMIIDDEFIHIGASNLTNRSFNVDSETDFAFTVSSKRDRKKIRRIMCDLLSEHTGNSIQKVEKEIEDSLIPYLDKQSKKKKGRLLYKYGRFKLAKFMIFFSRKSVFDSRFTFITPEEMFEITDKRSKRVYLLLLLIFFLFIIFTVFWEILAQMEYLNPRNAEILLENLRNNNLIFLVLLFAFLIGPFLSFPISLLIIITAILLSPVFAFILALAFSNLSFTIQFMVGRKWGKNLIEKSFSTKIKSFADRFADYGFINVLILRMTGIAPALIVNIVAGSTKMSFTDFLIASVIGIIPGILLTVLLGDNLRNFIINPNLKSSLIIILIFSSLIGASIYLRRKIIKKRFL